MKVKKLSLWQYEQRKFLTTALLLFFGFVLPSYKVAQILWLLDLGYVEVSRYSADLAMILQTGKMNEICHLSISFYFLDNFSCP